MIFQNPRAALNPIRKVGHQIEDVLLEHVKAAPSEVTEKAIAILDQVRIARPRERYHAYPFELSGGMRQRASICRAMLTEPHLLLMDEPFGALDALTRDELNFELQRTWLESGKTVVFITHSIDEALILADRIVVMSARPGRIKAILPNRLPSPRHVSVQLSPDYAALKSEIWQLVEAELLGHDETSNPSPAH